jgi:uncharacterized damage-inducible protein DinB
MSKPRELTPAEVAALLRAAGDALSAELSALPPEAAAWHPAPGEWCVNETLGHIIEAERRGFAGRIRRTLAGDTPAENDWDQVGVARERQDCARDAAEVAAEFAALRGESVAFVAGLDAASLDRACIHNKVGRLTVRDLLHEWVHHDRNHIGQIYDVMMAYVWPNMGGSQRFSAID